MSDTPSAPDQTGRRSLEITIDPCWRDHRFKGQAVLPAVAAMALLAGEVRRYFTAHPLSALISATFDKFLPLPPQAGPSGPKVKSFPLPMAPSSPPWPPGTRWAKVPWSG